jgi:hypothetical protein
LLAETNGNHVYIKKGGDAIYYTTRAQPHIRPAAAAGPEIYMLAPVGGWSNLQKEPGIKSKIYGQHTEKKEKKLLLAPGLASPLYA